MVAVEFISCKDGLFSRVGFWRDWPLCLYPWELAAALGVSFSLAFHPASSWAASLNYSCRFHVSLYVENVQTYQIQAKAMDLVE